MLIPLSVLNAVAPLLPSPAAWQAALDPATDRFQITSNARLGAFLAQAVVESGGFATLSENLNYSAADLVRVFPNAFSAQQALLYQHQPERIANRAYANRMGNGPEASGDGWNFRGRGLFQLTGRATYTQFAAAIGQSLDATCAYLLTCCGAAIGAGWFWQSRALNGYADCDDFTALTIHINGGTTTLPQRKIVWAKALAALAAAPASVDVTPSTPVASVPSGSTTIAFGTPIIEPPLA